MWIDKSTKISVETARLLGVPFAWESANGFVGLFYHKYVHTSEGPQLYLLNPTSNNAEWKPADGDWFAGVDDVDNVFLYLVREGEPCG